MLYWGDYLAMGIVYTVAVFLIGYVYGTWRQMGKDEALWKFYKSNR